MATAFREHRPGGDLDGLVDCIWAFSQAQAGSPESLILPDGCVEIVFPGKDPSASRGSGAGRQFAPRP
ncbi:MAG: hypothetical protein A3H96_11950 [Acidobacteria bacterium RIFCSPLOWO2_02_FULL_67_36]|nr:MAG: hypothetical protein A3H96_11950 [Acidobacteria bacterium RIFCSPLOWO2_02_FULL_67_36]OFW18599.1 MAG: hypothetical protein A3G21_21250 [Acidobacteria bacterium RIFCSPLOWO2_12_FULL_66_21]